jgi:hypothetical protein
MTSGDWAFSACGLYLSRLRQTGAALVTQHRFLKLAGKKKAKPIGSAGEFIP